jgi:DNA-binding LytR/AlgR family response regulator
MLNILLLDTLRNENANISGILKDAYARRDLPIKRLAVFYQMQSLMKNPIERLSRFDVFISSFTKLEDACVDLAVSFRRQSDKIFIVFAVDKNVDIASCVRPSVRLSGILFIPLDKLMIYKTIDEIYAEYRKISERGEQPVFTVKSGGEYFTVNTGEISFFEAQGKKIAIKTRGQEILFYSNFETVLEQLPDWFIRCHKGYVVNTKLIAQTNFTDMTIRLNDQSVIPVSRTYKDEVRSLIEQKSEVKAGVRLI